MTRKTLAEMLAADPAAVYIQDSDFAEDVSYTPFEGAARTIGVVVADDGTAMEPGEDGSETKIRRIRVYCQISSTLGIDDPQTGDELLRSGDDYPYVYSGEIFEQDAHSLLLEFWRREDLARGQGPA